MYYGNAAQPQQHPAAAYQNLPVNMGMGGGPAAAGMAGAACEPQQGQPCGLAPSSSPYSAAPPMLNLAKVRAAPCVRMCAGGGKEPCLCLLALIASGCLSFTAGLQRPSNLLPRPVSHLICGLRRRCLATTRLRRHPAAPQTPLSSMRPASRRRRRRRRSRSSSCCTTSRLPQPQLQPPSSRMWHSKRGRQALAW